MEQIVSAHGRRLWSGQLARPFAFRSPAPGEYALLLVVLAEDVTPEEQERLSEEFVRSGCRYAVCFGPTSSSGDDSIDWVGVDDELEGRDTPFVMTTWHDKEPLEDTVHFFAHNMRVDDWLATEYVALLIGGDSRDEEELRQLLLSHFS